MPPSKRKVAQAANSRKAPQVKAARARELEKDRIHDAPKSAAELRARAAELRAVVAEARVAEAWAAGARTAEAASATPMAEPGVRSLAQTTQIARAACPSPPERATRTTALLAHGPQPSGDPSAQASSEPSSDLVASLRAGLLALGHWDAFPAANEGTTWRSVPLGMNLNQWTQVLNAGMRPGGLAILLVTGTLVPARLHTAVLRLIAERLPGSSVIALNVGELDADTEAYDALVSAIAQPSCVLGHLYFSDPVSEAERKRKRRVRAQLRLNCAKPGYLAPLARDEVWALKGAHCWHNFSNVLRSRALVWAKANEPSSDLAAPPPRRTLRAPCQGQKQPLQADSAAQSCQGGAEGAAAAAALRWPTESPKAPAAEDREG